MLMRANEDEQTCSHRDPVGQRSVMTVPRHRDQIHGLTAGPGSQYFIVSQSAQPPKQQAGTFLWVVHVDYEIHSSKSGHISRIKTNISSSRVRFALPDI